MADQAETAKQRFFEVVSDTRAVMLGVEHSTQHFQPMDPQVDDENGSIWFFTRKSTDLVAAVGQGARAHMIVVGDDHDFHACCTGALRQNLDADKLEKFWSQSVSAWYEGGKDDPDLTMLHFVPDNAAVWISATTGIAFAWEIVKANVTDGTPDAGWRGHIQF